MDLAFERGITSFDTADGYTGGRSEEIVWESIEEQTAGGSFGDESCQPAKFRS